MKISFRDLFFDPNTFFLNLTNEKENLKIPALIVLVAATVSAIYGYAASAPTLQLMEKLMPGMGTIILLMAVAGAFIFTFLIWVIWAGVIHLLSSLLKGKGTFNRTLECIGYGYLPQIIGTIITLVLAFDYIPKVRIPSLSSTTDPEAIQQAMTALMKDPAMHELTMITLAVTIIFLIWSASIWIFGVKNIRQISLQNAAISVGLPLCAFISYSIYTLTVI